MIKMVNKSQIQRFIHLDHGHLTQSNFPSHIHKHQSAKLSTKNGVSEEYVWMAVQERTIGKGVGVRHYAIYYSIEYCVRPGSYSRV